MTSTLPGRLGNPDLTLATDPRADPRMVAAMAPAGAGARPAPMTLTVDSALATAILARREGRVDQIDGVFAQCPYVSNAYAEARAPGGPPSGLASLVENDGYFVATDNMALLAHLYDPGGAHRTDPLAWPLHATLDDLRGLPPHLITVNELDPLRDEGLLYYRKLLAAGVPAVGRVLTGTCHAGDRIFWRAMPDVYAASRRDVHGFAVAVAGN